jgi:anti-anti-sigma regulatory factor
MSGVPQGIFVACTAGVVYVRVVGRGTCRNSDCLRGFGLGKLREGHARVCVDLRQCEAMDSTFLGVFAGFALSMGSRGDLILLDVSADNRRAIVDLGLDQIASVAIPTGDTVRPEFPAESDFRLLPGSDCSGVDRPVDVVDQALLMLKCHEDLCRLDPRNERKFHDVKQFLREDIARHLGPKPPDS